MLKKVTQSHWYDSFEFLDGFHTLMVRGGDNLVPMNPRRPRQQMVVGVGISDMKSVGYSYAP